MAEFTAICQHCLKPLTAERSTRKYHDKCRSAAWRLSEKLKRDPLGCWICGGEIPGNRTTAAGKPAVLTTEQILRAECPECGASPGAECDRTPELAKLKGRAYARRKVRRSSHSRRVEDALAEMPSREREPRRYCSREHEVQARKMHRIYRDAEKGSGGRSVSRDGSGTITFALPEPVSAAAMERVLEVVRRPGRNTVIIRVPVVPEGPFEPDFADLTFTGSALTDRDGMWVAWALAGLGVTAPERQEPEPSLTVVDVPLSVEPEAADNAAFADKPVPHVPSDQPQPTWDDFMPPPD